uniref:Retrotransposon protein n=1 Tax=Tanacetum cinerariifolium TaxID=118510 RepID=A0A6L2NSV9_TANCI|nr:retrotransposon protein [Tanacetum cinerariifolium]
MSMEIKLTKDDEADSVDSSKYRGTRIETVVYADSTYAGDYVDRKSTSGICMFMRCCLTSWFAKKQMALAISTTEAEYVSAEKACQQALWMKLALIDYGILLDDVPIIGTKMPSEYQQDYKKTRAYAPKIYNDPNMPDTLRDIYSSLESRYVHEGRTIDLSFYNDLNDDSVTKFTAIGFDCLLSLDKKICPRRTVHEKIDKEGNTIYKLPKQVETNELFDHLRPCELVIRENVYSAIGNRDHTQAVIALMLYCLENRQPFNLAYFIVRRMYFFRDRRDKVLPYVMILTRLFKNLKANMPQNSFDERYKFFPRKSPHLRQNNPRDVTPRQGGIARHD